MNKDKDQEADVMEFTSEMARSTVRAAREHRVFLKTEKGQIASANAPVQDGDLICQLQGCSELVILREVQQNLAMGDPHRRYHKLVGKVYLTGWKGSGKLAKDFPVDSTFDIFEIV